MELCLIWAQDRRGAMGSGGRMPWLLPEHLEHCRRMTAGCPVTMGRRTWQALGAKPLPGRLNIVLTRTLKAESLIGATRALHLNDAMMLAGIGGTARAFVIGGASVFERALPVAQRVYVTEVHADVPNADAFAPRLAAQQWRLDIEGPVLTSHTGLTYRFLEYRSTKRR